MIPTSALSVLNLFPFFIYFDRYLFYFLHRNLINFYTQSPYLYYLISVLKHKASYYCTSIIIIWYYLSAQSWSGSNPAYCAGSTEFKSRSHHKCYSFARVAESIGGWNSWVIPAHSRQTNPTQPPQEAWLILGMLNKDSGMISSDRFPVCRWRTVIPATKSFLWVLGNMWRVCRVKGQNYERFTGIKRWTRPFSTWTKWRVSSSPSVSSCSCRELVI